MSSSRTKEILKRQAVEDIACIRRHEKQHAMGVADATARARRLHRLLANRLGRADWYDVEAEARRVPEYEGEFMRCFKAARRRWFDRD
jgi:hypothetical protein